MHGLKIVVQKLVNDNSNNSTQQSTALALLYDNLKLGVIRYFYALSIKIDQVWTQVDDKCKVHIFWEILKFYGLLKIYEL